VAWHQRLQPVATLPAERHAAGGAGEWVSPPEYRGVISDELLVRPQDVALEKWLGKGCFGDVYPRERCGGEGALRARTPAPPLPRRALRLGMTGGWA
jgi:hypothetical protein